MNEQENYVSECHRSSPAEGSKMLEEAKRGAWVRILNKSNCLPGRPPGSGARCYIVLKYTGIKGIIRIYRSHNLIVLRVPTYITFTDFRLSVYDEGEIFRISPIAASPPHQEAVQEDQLVERAAYGALLGQGQGGATGGDVYYGEALCSIEVKGENAHGRNIQFIPDRRNDDRCQNIIHHPPLSTLIQYLGSCLPFTVGPRLPAAIFLFSLIPSARADPGDDFANNLFSDLAPILALFGEQVAKQFLSESTTWADNILFAMAPLGIITGIVSAIRVAGGPLLKAIVGRGKEGLGQVELELMSSNSPDVGEMWNGQAIVRVLGAPSIFEFVYDADEVVEDPSGSIGVLNGDNPFFQRVMQTDKGIRSRSPPVHLNELDDIELRAQLLDPNENAQDRRANDVLSPPNILLNARGEPVGNFEKWSMAIMGIGVQLAVLVFEGIITYHPTWKTSFRKNGLIPPPRAFQMAAVGTISVNLGMLICAYVVEGASTEEKWVLKDQGRRNCKVSWVQKGGTVNDQVFEPYIILGHKGQKVIRTSHRCSKQDAEQLRLWVLLGTFVSVTGFVVQFIGLRGMNWAATIAQLIATVLMTIVRLLVRRRMIKEPETAEALEGCELDCMARNIAGCSGWKIVANSLQHDQPPNDELAKVVLQVRKRLDELVRWPTNVDDTARSLCAAMERTMNSIYNSNDFRLVREASRATELSWTLRVLAFRGKLPQYEQLTFKISRSQVWDGWEVSEDTKSAMIAVLSLWTLNFREEERYSRSVTVERTPTTGVNRIAKAVIWPSQVVDKERFALWVGRQAFDIRFGDHKNILRQEQIPQYRSICQPSATEPVDFTTVTLIPDVSVLEKHFAQQIFSEFFSAVVPLINQITGSTKIYQGDQDNVRQIQNSALTQLVGNICETALGTPVEILMGIVPHLGNHGKLPEEEGEAGTLIRHSYVQSQLRSYRQRNQWHLVVLQIHQLIGDHKRDQLQSGPVVVRFYKTIMTLLSPDTGSSEVSHRQKLLLEWLENVSIDDISSLSGDSPSPHEPLELPEYVSRNCKPEILEKVCKLLAPFGPFPQFMDRDDEMVLLKRTMNATTKEEMVQILKRAVEEGYDTVVEALIDRKLDTRNLENPKVVEGPLVVAASRGHSSVVQVLLTQLSVDFPNDYRQFQAGYKLQTLLLWNAANNGDLLTVQVVLRDTTMITRSDSREIALYLAARNGHVDIVKEIIMAGANLNYKSDEDDSRMFLSEKLAKTRIWVKEWLKGSLPAVLVLKLLGGPGENQDNGTDLLKQGDTNGLSRWISGRAALQTAAEGGHMPVVDQLLKSGTHVNGESSSTRWRTALQAAAQIGHLPVVQRLLESGANVNSKPCNWSGRTALQAAADGGHLAVVDRLLEVGATVNAEPASYGGRTALQAAAEGGHLAVVDRLLEVGATVNAEPASYGGRTALQAAAEGGHLAVVDRLLEVGATVNAEPAFYRRTALQAALGGGHQEVADRLRRAGAR